jgi:hypothetical protein
MPRKKTAKTVEARPTLCVQRYETFSDRCRFMWPVEVPGMAAIILVLSGVVVWLEVHAMRRMARTSLRAAQAAYPTAAGSRIEDLLDETAGAIATLLDLRACWFEPFPFDTLLPRIEQGRIVVPAPEPGVAPCSGLGVELPVRANGLTLGRFVLIPGVPSTGVIFAPTARNHATALAAQSGTRVAAALIDGDLSRLFGDKSPPRVPRPGA